MEEFANEIDQTLVKIKVKKQEKQNVRKMKLVVILRLKKLESFKAAASEPPQPQSLKQETSF